MTTKSPRWAARSTVSSRPERSRRRSISASTASSSAAGSRRPTSSPLYSPSFAFGRTPISIENFSGSPWRGRSPRSRSGSPTGTIAAASIAALYQVPMKSRTASSSTAWRPMRLITTGAGALPARKPGTRSVRPSCARRRGDALLDLLGGHLGLDAHARLGQLGDGGGDGNGHGGPQRYRRGMRDRLTGWLICGPLGHAWAGVADLVEAVAGARRAARRRARSGRWRAAPGRRARTRSMRARAASARAGRRTRTVEPWPARS